VKPLVDVYRTPEKVNEGRFLISSCTGCCVNLEGPNGPKGHVPCLGCVNHRTGYNHTLSVERHVLAYIMPGNIVPPAPER
jgi:hypothetical protein